MTPTHAASPCLESGCFALATHKGRCAKCQLLAPPSTRLSARGRGYTRKWEKRRIRHLQAEPFCRMCGELGNQVDHVIPHRGAEWLFKLPGNLQTLCRHHHAKKSNHERTIPIDMMYPLDLPEAPHSRPVLLLCGPIVERPEGRTDLVVDGLGGSYEGRNELLRKHLLLETRTPFAFIVSAPRTAERAFWSHVMGCEAGLVPPSGPPAGHVKGWWNEYQLDQRAEEAMERRIG